MDQVAALRERGAADGVAAAEATAVAGELHRWSKWLQTCAGENHVVTGGGGRQFFRKKRPEQRNLPPKTKKKRRGTRPWKFELSTRDKEASAEEGGENQRGLIYQERTR